MLNDDELSPTNVDVMRPFDRSFLMKRQLSGVDLFTEIKYKPGNKTY